MKKCVMCNVSFSNEALKFCPRCHCRLVDEKPSSNIPKCPICGSFNLSKITTTKKVAKIALFGIFGMGDNGKTWKCNNCGSKF